MKVEEYFRKGLLRKGEIDKNEIKGSIELAERFLERAKGNMKIKYFDVAFILGIIACSMRQELCFFLLV